AVLTQVDVLVELDLQGVAAVGHHADVAVRQRGLIDRPAHQVHRLAQQPVHVCTGIAGTRQRSVGQPGELVYVHCIGAVHARGDVVDHLTTGADAVVGESRAIGGGADQPGTAQVHVITHANPRAVDHCVTGGHAVHVQIAVQGDLDHAFLVVSGLGHGDVLVALEIHRTVRADVHLILAGTGQV